MNTHINIPNPAREIVASIEELPKPERDHANPATTGETIASDVTMTGLTPMPNVIRDAFDAPERSHVAPAVPAEHSPAISSMPDGYAFFTDGIYFLPDDEATAPVFLCTPLRVVATFADGQGRGWGRLVSVKSADERWHEIPIASADLQRKPAEVVAQLVDHGLELAADKKSKDRVLNLLKIWKPGRHLRTVNRMGWCGETHASFVLGSRLIGANDVLPFAPATGIGAGLVESGTLESWRSGIGKRCSGNPLLVIAVSLALTGPLLAPLGLAGGGLHFRGASSSGKTTLLKVAASVWGDRRLITPWRATSNGLEAIAATMNDMLLPLDEIAEIQSRVLHDAIYMLANGTGKARMTKSAVLADQARWRLALISSGEISIEEKLREGRLNAMAGHEVRMIDIEADSRNFGAFDDLHGATNAAAFADTLQQDTRKHHGSVGHVFVTKLISSNLLAKTDSMGRIIRSTASRWCSTLPGVVDGQTHRVALRFALIGLTGTIATQLGLTGWQKDEATTAAELLFFDWYERRYGARRDAADAFVTTLQQFLSANLASLPVVGDTATAGTDPIGWRNETRVYLPLVTWSQLFPGDAGHKAATALRDMQMLMTGDEGRLTRKAPRAIPGRPRLYTVVIDRVAAYKVI